MKPSPAIKRKARLAAFLLLAAGAPQAVHASIEFFPEKTQTPAALAIGGPVQYGIKITNVGTDAIESLTVVDTISPAIQLTGIVAPGFPPPVITVIPEGTLLEWNGIFMGILPTQSE